MKFCLNRTARNAMMRQDKTIQWLLAGYLALLMPLCCCYASVATECSTPVNESVERAQAHHEQDHGEHASKHEGGHDHQEPIDDHNKCDPSCPGHDNGPCDCECDNSGLRSFTIQQPTSIDALLGFSHLVPTFLTIAFCEQVGPNEPATNPPLRLTSLVRMHCALIV